MYVCVCWEGVVLMAKSVSLVGEACTFLGMGSLPSYVPRTGTMGPRGDFSGQPLQLFLG